MPLGPAVLDLQYEKSKFGLRRGGYVVLSLISVKNPVREKDFLPWLKEGIWDEML